jgi:hypothetical protein
MGSKSRETLYGASIRAAAKLAMKHVRKPTGPPSRAAVLIMAGQAVN